MRKILTKSGLELLSEKRDRLCTCRLCLVEQSNCNTSRFIRLMQVGIGVFRRFLSPNKNIVCMCVISYCMYEIIVLE